MVCGRSQNMTGVLRSTLVLLIGLALGLAFWVATAPVAKAKEITPTEMIQSKLPSTKTLVTAAKPEVLSAVCGAVRKWRNDAAQIVRTAAGARKEFAGPIVAEAIRCLREHPDCNITGQVVAAGLAADPEASATIMEQALELAPDCRAQIEQAAGGGEGEGATATQSSNENPPPGTLGAGAGHQACVVCHNIQHNPQTLTIDCNALPAHLAHGDTEGPCQATQVQNP